MAKIKINASEWNALSPDDKQQIESILRRAGSIGKGDEIVADEATPVAGFTSENVMHAESIWCKMACNAAEAAAVIACGALSGPAMAVCIAAAHAAGEECRKRC